MEVLLNSNKNIKSVNSAIYNKIELKNNISPILEYDINNILSVTEIFNTEREENAVYRIYGRIEYLSMLNGLKNNNVYISDYFNPQMTNCKTLLNSFDFYLLRASTAFTKIINSDVNYIRYFEVIATPNEFDIYPAAYSKNIFNEQIYAFNFTKEFDVSNYFDYFNFPATELFLYAKYNPQIITYSGDSSRRMPDTYIGETISYIEWNINTQTPTIIDLNPNSLAIGDLVYGDIIQYSKTDFSQEVLIDQTYYITTPYGSAQHIVPLPFLKWKYNPFIPLQLRYFGNEIYTENTGNTITEVIESIPNYATKLDNVGNCVWRNILAQGYTDPISNVGVDYPFVNLRRYLFGNIILSVIPDTTDSTTNSQLTNLIFNNPTPLSSVPSSELNTFNAPC